MRGGKRQGRTGAKYSNRSDLQNGVRLPVQAAPSQHYGERVRLEEAQRALPLRRAATAISPGSGPAPVALAVPTSPPPGAPLDAPTQFPDEPVTAGSQYGSGPGPEALAGSPQRLSELLDALPATGDLADLRVFARQRGL